MPVTSTTLKGLFKSPIMQARRCHSAQFIEAHKADLKGKNMHEQSESIMKTMSTFSMLSDKSKRPAQRIGHEEEGMSFRRFEFKDGSALVTTMDSRDHGDEAVWEWGFGVHSAWIEVTERQNVFRYRDLMFAKIYPTTVSPGIKDLAMDRGYNENRFLRFGDVVCGWLLRAEMETNTDSSSSGTIEPIEGLQDVTINANDFLRGLENAV